ncbi:DUF4826 family protein [Colwellia sp. D2M02]|uniref:DUF4826 family protein n=1 Tax=Colwellia sp. D2M02 TaxID=2841562 RepID=UPI001C0847A7|nr:DUF4826 family protein [Colwellia sp. D2M02]MBU2892332.1 DUF4826 family protein [Colwellia sp. D2M02]
MTQEVAMTTQEQQQWIKDQYQVATKYLAEKGLVTQSVTAEESRYLTPMIAIWKLTVTGGSKYWVICGDLPTDHSSIDVATTARDALKHFSLKWQLQAENLLQSDNNAQKNFAGFLISRAEGLYQVCDNESLWQA